MLPFDFQLPWLPMDEQEQLAVDLVSVSPVTVLCASGLSAVTVPMAIAAGASGVAVGSAVNRLDDELAMVAVVRGLREALSSRVPAHV